ncbi:sensor histidine kinase [Alterisphingorhabdus coralli]|uniref:Histidine kinase n=1 Tax=Alterisphingorhabdus coralli TaxID=3071408 RepID=A0AA97F889_9SPHN|nr:histidine kinase [Parasphingorhabdus sp. SCSIO 66989]WOE75306.1 histidine kinase [Parasphingorhabdus sp. SCSIO 66989]
MIKTRALFPGKPTVDFQVALLSILGFWLFYIIITTIRSLIIDYPVDQAEVAVRRVYVTLFGIVVTIGLYMVMRAFDHKPLGLRIAIAFLGAVPCALLIGCFNYLVFNVYDPASLFRDQKALEEFKELPPIGVIMEVAMSRIFFLVAWAGLYLAISYAGEVRFAERRASRFAQAAQQAELRSLRYQVNPHFLFNTLNSLSSLVLRNRPAEADAMIMNLSTFYRNSLSGDPLDDVPLEEEVELQRLYLDIEQVRFPERLKVDISIPDDLMDVCVPGLILQPLVENAIKYGVSRTSRPVTVSISAESRGDLLTLTVCDDGDPVMVDIDSSESNGIGLANVRDRLETRFGESGALQTEAHAGGGYCARLTLPISRKSDSDDLI